LPLPKKEIPKKEKVISLEFQNEFTISKKGNTKKGKVNSLT